MSPPSARCADTPWPAPAATALAAAPGTSATRIWPATNGAVCGAEASDAEGASTPPGSVGDTSKHEPATIESRTTGSARRVDRRTDVMCPPCSGAPGAPEETAAGMPDFGFYLVYKTD